MQLLLFRQLIRLISRAAKQQRDPLVLREAGARLFDLIQIQIRHLDGFERRDLKRRIIFGFFLPDLFLLFLIAEEILLVILLRAISLFEADILDFDDAPDTADQELFIMHDQIPRDLERIEPEIGEAGDILVLTFIENDRDLINDRILPVLLDF